MGHEIEKATVDLAPLYACSVDDNLTPSVSIS